MKRTQTTFWMALAVCSLLAFAVTSAQAQISNPRSPNPAPRSPQGTAPRATAPRARNPQGQPRQPVQRPAGQQPLQRPAAEPLRVPPLDPQIEGILQQWEVSSGKIRTLSGEFWKFTYDKVFGVEKHAHGEFEYEAPDKGTYSVVGKISRSKKPQAREDGEPYKVEADITERWVCTGKEIYQINDREQTYERVSIPPEAQGENIMNGPLPFLFGMKAEEAARRYQFKLKHINDDIIWLEAIPLREVDRANFKVAQVILSRKNFLPTAVELTDPTGNKRTVHSFNASSLDVNARRFLPKADPLKDLVKYRETIPPAQAEAPRRRTSRPVQPGISQSASNEVDERPYVPRSRVTPTGAP